jgi:drug/metabolite transporter (DMT)-like permease
VLLVCFPALTTRPHAPGNTIFTHIGVRYINPFVFTAWRSVLSTAALFVVARVKEGTRTDIYAKRDVRQARVSAAVCCLPLPATRCPLPAAHYPLPSKCPSDALIADVVQVVLLALNALTLSLQMLSFSLGLSLTTASLSSVLAPLTAVFAAGMAVLAGREAMRAMKAAGLCVCAVGVLVLFQVWDVSASGNASGNIVIVVNCFISALLINVQTVLMAGDRLRQTVHVMALSYLISVPLCVGVAGAFVSRKVCDQQLHS